VELESLMLYKEDKEEEVKSEEVDKVVSLEED
jgi:hypothetical protein